MSLAISDAESPSAVWNASRGRNLHAMLEHLDKRNVWRRALHFVTVAHKREAAMLEGVSQYRRNQVRFTNSGLASDGRYGTLPGRSGIHERS
jgi:hypothetical protein